MLTFSVNKDRYKFVKEMTAKSFIAKTDNEREWLSSIWQNALEGKFKDSNDVNIGAYAYKCSKNEDLGNSKFVPILQTEEITEQGLKGVSENMLSYMDNQVERILDLSEVNHFVVEFIDTREYLLIEEGVDIWRLINVAKTQNPKAIDMLKGLIEKYNMATLVQNILGKEDCIEALKEVLPVW